MLRRELLAFAALALISCAHKPINDPTAPIVQATARVMIAALAEEQSPQRGYGWDALFARIADDAHWHAAAPDSADGPPDAIRQRDGWIEAGSVHMPIAAQGLDDRVTQMKFEHMNAFYALALLESLAAQGATVSFQADYESFSEYVVSAPGRESALLTIANSCPPLEENAGRDCGQMLTLAFELP
jgi:hypothetical protein